MTNTEDSIVAARDMYSKCLQDSLSPFIIFLFRDMFGKMPKSKRTLRNLQMQLREVKTWNGHQVKEVVDDIIKSQSREYYEDLLTAILVSNAEILSTISIVKNPPKINLKIPKLENYIHECIINVARALYKNAFLFDENVSSLQRQRHNNEFDLLVRDAIQSSIQQILPIQDIIKQYIMAGSGPDLSKDDDVFLPDDELPDPVEPPPMDESLREYMRHGNTEEEIAPEDIEIAEPEELLEQAFEQSTDPIDFLDENEREPGLEVDEERKGRQERKQDKEGSDENLHDKAAGDEVDGSEEVQKDAENTRGHGFSLVKRSGSGLFVEDEADGDDVDDIDKDIERKHGESRTEDGCDPVSVDVQHGKYDSKSDKGQKDEQVVGKGTPEMSRDEKLSLIMLPKSKVETTEIKSIPQSTLLESDDDDLSLYGLSDGNTNWSDDDNEFAYTDDELLTSDGEDDENVGEDIDTMINRIRTASHDTEPLDIKISGNKKSEKDLTPGGKTPAAPKSDVSTSLDIEIDLPNSDGDADEPEEGEEVVPLQDVKTIHIEERPSKNKSRKSRKSKKAKSPVILFPDAASEDECV